MTDLKAAHDKSSYHRSEIESSKVCGCFYCLHVFLPSDIEEWIDGKQTALCPRCGIDSVIAEASGLPLTEEFLKEMEQYWFSYHRCSTGENK